MEEQIQSQDVVYLKVGELEMRFDLIVQYSWFRNNININDIILLSFQISTSSTYSCSAWNLVTTCSYGPTWCQISRWSCNCNDENANQSWRSKHHQNFVGKNCCGLLQDQVYIRPHISHFSSTKMLLNLF